MSTTPLAPVILGVADSTHYLVGEKDLSDNFIGLDAGDVKVVKSLAQAKQYLREHNIYSATLELQTAYDEMCGLGVTGSSSEKIHF
ncbi:DUF6482 family protein [Thalassotalea aquiviva]|uniref:DUF6482 family protein n=1 Tax=Thalassotalea aquiviva TaxID=3242415 RepID=UPI00352AF866